MASRRGLHGSDERMRHHRIAYGSVRDVGPRGHARSVDRYEELDHDERGRVRQGRDRIGRGHENRRPSTGRLWELPRGGPGWNFVGLPLALTCDELYYTINKITPGEVRFRGVRVRLDALGPGQPN